VFPTVFKIVTYTEYCQPLLPQKAHISENAISKSAIVPLHERPPHKLYSHAIYSSPRARVPLPDVGTSKFQRAVEPLVFSPVTFLFGPETLVRNYKALETSRPTITSALYRAAILKFDRKKTAHLNSEYPGRPIGSTFLPYQSRFLCLTARPVKKRVQNKPKPLKESVKLSILSISHSRKLGDAY
jgi:hypothetical protein